MRRYTVAAAVAVLLAAGAPAWATFNLTFYALSDTHYGQQTTTTQTAIEIERANIDLMNSVAGGGSKTFPAGIGGGVVQAPRGVLMPGDLIDTSNNTTQWNTWVGDFSMYGTGRLQYPVYETWGNHDGGPNAFTQNTLKARNEQRLADGKLNQLSSNHLFYSWDWGPVHLVNVGLYPGDVRDPNGQVSGAYHDPEMSLSFLKQDLAANVGGSRRPVIIEHHFSILDADNFWWTAAERAAYYDAIKDYNVVAIMFGHTGAAGYGTWNGINYINTGSSQVPGFSVVQFTDNQMKGGFVNLNGTWSATFSKTVQLPEPGTLGLLAAGGLLVLRRRRV